MRVRVEGGAGGGAPGSGADAQGDTQGGYGGYVYGNFPVTPGQTVLMTAGGQGLIDGTRGLSQAGSGGTAYDGGGGGGGGGSRVLLDGVVAAWAGGGGGGSVAYHNGTAYTPRFNDGQTGAPGETGVSRYLVPPGGDLSDAFSIANGGNPGTETTPGTGGGFSGQRVRAKVGRAASGTNGGFGQTTPEDLRAGTGGSGAGGGGYQGGGSGGTLYAVVNNDHGVIPGGGGGGSNYLNPGLTATVVAQAGFVRAGRVIINIAS
ncbi:hypothetical protein H9Q74_007386 [Fusarium xylarioides]|nr:hypothetical protein H9Q71_007883 [Fusarium xylarioides]KAG5822520.1 hypothetical protein H9Q74_007386 [Fusarium xylarioides]